MTGSGLRAADVDLAALEKLPTYQPLPQHQQERQQSTHNVQGKSTWHNTDLQSIKQDVFHFCFPNLTEISLVGKTYL